MLLHIFAWYDKVDKAYMAGTIMADRSPRAVYRGYMAEFGKNRAMNKDEFELHEIGTIDEQTGEVTAFNPHHVPDVTCVFANRDTASGEVVDE